MTKPTPAEQIRSLKTQLDEADSEVAARALSAATDGPITFNGSATTSVDGFKVKVTLDGENLKVLVDNMVMFCDSSDELRRVIDVLVGRAKVVKNAIMMFKNIGIRAQREQYKIDRQYDTAGIHAEVGDYGLTVKIQFGDNSVALFGYNSGGGGYSKKVNLEDLLDKSSLIRLIDAARSAEAQQLARFR